MDVEASSPEGCARGAGGSPGWARSRALCNRCRRSGNGDRWRTRRCSPPRSITESPSRRASSSGRVFRAGMDDHNLGEIGGTCPASEADTPAGAVGGLPWRAQEIDDGSGPIGDSPDQASRPALGGARRVRTTVTPVPEIASLSPVLRDRGGAASAGSATGLRGSSPGTAAQHIGTRSRPHRAGFSIESHPALRREAWSRMETERRWSP